MDLGTEDDAAYVLFDRAEGPLVNEEEDERKNRKRSMQVDRSSCLSLSRSVTELQR